MNRGQTQQIWPPPPMKSDHWFHDLFKAMPDLVRHLLPELAADRPAASAYTFRPLVLKKQAHSPDGVLWPREHPGGSDAWPVVLLEVQMHPDRGFQRRLGAETFRLVQQQEQIEHLRVVVLLAHRRLGLGSRGPLLSAAPRAASRLDGADSSYSLRTLHGPLPCTNHDHTPHFSRRLAAHPRLSRNARRRAHGRAC